MSVIRITRLYIYLKLGDSDTICNFVYWAVTNTKNITFKSHALSNSIISCTNRELCQNERQFARFDNISCTQLNT